MKDHMAESKGSFVQQNFRHNTRTVKEAHKKEFHGTAAISLAKHELQKA